MNVDTSGWSGEGTFTQVLIDRLKQLDGVAFVRVEDAPASRSEADYNFISNEIFVQFSTTDREERTTRFGFLPARRVVPGEDDDRRRPRAGAGGRRSIGAPDYSDDGMIQYLRAERIVPPYQTQGYKLVELVRIYEARPTTDS